MTTRKRVGGRNFQMEGVITRTCEEAMVEPWTSLLALAQEVGRSRSVNEASPHATLNSVKSMPDN